MPHSSACPKLRRRRSVEPRLILFSKPCKIRQIMIKELGTDRLKRTNQMSPWCISGGSSWFNTQAVTSKGSFRSSKWPAEPCRESKDGSKDSAGDCTCVVEKAGLSRPLKFWTRLGDGEVNQRCRCKKEEHPSNSKHILAKNRKATS